VNIDDQSTENGYIDHFERECVGNITIVDKLLERMATVFPL